MHNICLGMTRGDATPLTELLQVLHSVIARQHKYRIEHRRHMTGVKEQSVAEWIRRIFGVIAQELGIEQIYKIRTTHSTSGVTRFSLFYHSCSQNTNVIGRFVEFRVSKHILLLLICLYYSSCKYTNISIFFDKGHILDHKISCGLQE